VSTRRRIVRTSSLVLTLLAVGSILSASLLGTPAIGPHKAFAETSAPATGALGVGERTIAPLTASVTSADKVPLERSVSATAVAALSTSAVKRTSTTAQYRHAVRMVRRPTAVTIGIGMLGSWKRALCSWYGPGLYGTALAAGGRLGHNDMIVAHKHLPFGTKIQFKLKGRSVTATVRDRGPYVGARQFDLGPGIARSLGFDGVGMVSYRILSMGKGRRRG
jgi:rare lipoprotein A